MVTKHSEHPCKECKEKLPTFMDLLKHVAKHHCKEQDTEQVENNFIQDQGDHKEVETKEVKSYFVFQSEAQKNHVEDDEVLKGLEDNKEEDKKGSSLVFSESMLDEFLEDNN